MIEDREVKRCYVPVSLPTASQGISAENAAREISQRVRDFGAFVLPDGQILRQEITPSQVDDFFQYDDLSPDPEPPTQRPWTPEQAEYFGIERPYQINDGPEMYAYPSVMVDFAESYLDAGELILALVHATRDGRYYYCTCHEAQVVYTTKRKVLCMVCGALHCVLKQPIAVEDGMRITSAQWFELFDEANEFLDDSVDLRIVDFQDIERAERLWETDHYVECAREVTFFARASPEEFARYRGSIVTPGMLIEAGFHHVPTPPPPAGQVRDEIALDLVDNAADSLLSGATAYVRSRGDVGEIKRAVLDLFHVVELLFKARLDALDPAALEKKPNNPAVVAQLQKHGVALTDEELQTIAHLRKLRNALQHGEAELGYRSSRRVLRGSLQFLDRFASEELGLWIGEVVGADDWWQLLRIPSIRDRAKQHADAVVAELDPEQQSVTACPRCTGPTLIRSFMQGSVCAYCGYRPRIEELMPEAFPELGGEDPG